MVTGGDEVVTGGDGRIASLVLRIASAARVPAEERLQLRQVPKREFRCF